MLSWRFLCNLIDIHEYNVTRDTLRLSWLNQSAPRTPCTTCWCMLPATLLVILYHFDQHGRSPHRYSWDLYKDLHNLCMTSDYKLSRVPFSVTSSWWVTWIAKIIKISGGPCWEDVKKLTRWCDDVLKQVKLAEGLGIDVPLCISNASRERVWGTFVWVCTWGC